MNTSIENLKEKGFVVLSYPKDLRKAVERTVESWKGFCDLPVGVKRNLLYSSGADGVGYELKDGSGNKGDQKENFDATIAGRNWLEINSKKIESPIALEFVGNITSLVHLMKPLILDFAKQAELAFGMDGFEKEVEESEPTFFVRFIHYFGERIEGEETASAHVDQSGFALHLFESAPGFQYLSYGGAWTNLSYPPEQAVIFPAMQLQLRSKGQIRALCHRVLSTEETAKGGRYSAVCFVQLKNTPKYDKDKHGRLQEKEPGFNYHVTDKEFQEFFRK